MAAHPKQRKHKLLKMLWFCWELEAAWTVVYRSVVLQGSFLVKTIKIAALPNKNAMEFALS